MAEVGIGYLVKRDGHLWLVTGYNGSWAWLERFDKGAVQKCDLSENSLGSKEVHDPAIAWGFLPLKGPYPIRERGARAVYSNGKLLKPLQDWVPNPPSWDMPVRGLYLAPTLKLQVGEVITMVTESGYTTGAKITGKFGSIAKRLMALTVPEGPKTRWDHIEDL